MVPLSEETDPVQEVKALVKELEKYDAELFNKPRWLVLNKIDMLAEDSREDACKKFVKDVGVGWAFFCAFCINQPRLHCVDIQDYGTFGTMCRSRC